MILRFIKLKKLDTSSEHQKQRDTHEHTSTSNVRSLSSRKMTRSRSLVSLETRDMVAKPPKPPNLLCSSSMATSLCLFLSGGTRRSLHRRSHPKCSPRMSPPLLYALSALILSAGNRGCSSGCSSGALTLLMFPQTEHWCRQRPVRALLRTQRRARCSGSAPLFWPHETCSNETWTGSESGTLRCHIAACAFGFGGTRPLCAGTSERR